jgi:hypothetical protein
LWDGRSLYRAVRSIENIGSAHEVELAALKTVAAVRLAAGQTELGLGLSGGVEPGTLAFSSSQMAHGDPIVLRPNAIRHSDVLAAMRGEGEGVDDRRLHGRPLNLGVCTNRCNRLVR